MAAPRRVRRRLGMAFLFASVALATGVAGATPAPLQAWTHPLPVATFAATAERIYVGAIAGLEEARAFVQGERGATVTLVEARDGTVTVDRPGLAACPLTTPLVRAREVTAAAAPAVDCSKPTQLTRAANGTWAVAITGEYGAALVPAGGGTFRVAFDTARTTVTPPAAPALQQDLSVEPPPNSAESTDTFALEIRAIADAAPVATVELASPPAPVKAAAAVARATRSAASPPALIVLSLVAVVAGAGAVAVPRVRARPRSARLPVAGPARLGLPVAACVLLPMLLSEANVYRLGLVLIFFTGAIGLHLLVNWAGELSLAHAALVGLPAFVVAKLSADHGLSPIVLLPLALLVGLVAGGVIGVPAIRARGIQVALVTLAAGVAIDRFFFTKSWIVGPGGGSQVSVPTLGPLTFGSARALYPVLAVTVLVTVAALRAFHRSKLGRGLLWVKLQPDAAAAFGIPVARYRTMAYALAGGIAGLSGGLTAMWVQRLTPQAFPLTRSFTYLIIVALAGRGFVGGVAAAAAIVEGGRLFLPNADALLSYGAPAGLILTLTQNPAGLNGLGRRLKEHLMRAISRFRPLLVGGVVAVAVGFAAIALAWYHAGNTSQVWVQNQELVSGGVGGLALVVVGIGLVVCDRLGQLVAGTRQEP